MNNAYIYACTRAKVLEQKLLTENQLERLLSAKSTSEAFAALQDTYLSSYLTKHEDTDITEALDASIAQAKQTLASIAPFPEILDILWVKYDFHNLKTFIKGTKAGLSEDEILSKCFTVGTYAPAKLLTAFNEGKLGLIDTTFQKAVETATTSKKVFEIDTTMNLYYFVVIKELARLSKDAFVKEYVRLQVDLFNVKAALRALTLQEVSFADIYVQGGSIALNNLETEESILLQTKNIGGEKKWAEAIAVFKETRNYYPLEKIADDHIGEFLKEKNIDVFTSAPLFSYFHAQKNNAQTIGAIIAAKQSNMPEKELRKILRRLY